MSSEAANCKRARTSRDEPVHFDVEARERFVNGVVLQSEPLVALVLTTLTENVQMR